MGCSHACSLGVLIATGLASLSIPLAPAMAEPTFFGLGALEDPFVHSFHPIVRAPDGSGIAVKACDSAYSTDYLTHCKPFRFVPYGENAELSLLPGDTDGQAWAMTPSGHVIVGTSGRTAVRWTHGGGAIPLITHGISGSSWARAVSSDGSLISGQGVVSASTGYTRAFAWTDATGYVEIFDPAVPLLMRRSNWVGQSDAGQVVAFLNQSYPSPGKTRAVRWTPARGFETLFPIPPDFLSSDAKDVAESTGDVVGTLWTDGQNSSLGIGYRWTPALGMQTLAPPPSHQESRGLRISRDGTTILGTYIGRLTGDLESEAFRWSASMGAVSLGPAPGFERTAPAGLSDGGEAIWGSMDSDWVERVYDAVNAFDVHETRIEKRSFIWTAETGRIDVPQGTELLSNCDHDYWTQVEDVPADGHVAFGRTSCDERDSFFEYFDPYTGWVVDQYPGRTRYVAFAWDPISGFRTVADYFAQEYGLDMTGWEIDSVEIDDADGGILYGGGIHGGRREGWVLYLPEPSLASIVAAGSAGLGIVARRRRRRSA